MARRAVLTYDGTRLHSSGAQLLRATTAEAGGGALEGFRLKCTDASMPDLVRIDLRNCTEHRKFVATAHDLCWAQFGEPAADFGRDAGGMSNWFLDKSTFLSALRLVDSLQPIPVEVPFGLLAVTYKISFRFVQPLSGLPFPFQHPDDYLNAEADYYRYLGGSFLEAVFSDRHTISAFLSLPFEDWNEEAAALVRFIQSELPFKISAKRWKRWHLNQADTGYVGRRMAVSWNTPTA